MGPHGVHPSVACLVLLSSVLHVVSGDYGNIVLESTSKLGCRIRPVDRDAVQYLQDRSVMYIFEVKMYNYTVDPLRADISTTYKPWKWYRTLSEYGKTLLTLSFNYDVLSLTILTIGVERVPLMVKDVPFGCFGNLTAEQRENMVREKVFDNFWNKKSLESDLSQQDLLDDASEGDELVYVCNEEIITNDGYAEFANRCCAKDSQGRITCSDKEDNYWVTVLYLCIALVKLMLFMFCPLFIPQHMYTASYVASEYVVKLTRQFKLKVFISRDSTTSVRYKHRLTRDDIKDWTRLTESIENLPEDEIFTGNVTELRIKVQGKRVITANEPPTGLLRTLYDNLIRCKIRGLHPFKECCEGSIYASLQPLIRHKFTWEDLVNFTVKFIVMCLVPFPFYVRVFIYYRFEEVELVRRNDMVEALGLKRAFNPFRSSIIQYLTPVNGLFVTCYVLYFMCGFILAVSGEHVREKMKSIFRAALQDMRNVSRTSVLQIVLAWLLWPFRKCGLLAFLVCPIFSVAAAPACGAIFTLYCIPTIYLSYRLLYQSRKRLGHGTTFIDSGEPMGKAKKNVRKIHKKLAHIDKGVHLTHNTLSEADKQSPCMYGYGRCFVLQRFLLRVAVGLFSLLLLYTLVLLFVETIGVCVEVMAFTMMGIIVNAGATLRYVSMALLVIVYMHNCYDNVYDNYLTFNTVITDEVMDRAEDLKKIASLPSSMQENFAFQLKPVEAVDEIPTAFNLEKRLPQWRIGHLLIFLDSYDTPRIPLNLFKKLCEVRVHGAPGPVYLNLLRATGKFSIIVVFLFFVMLVVMAFGSSHQMSSTNQTLGILAGGFVPMLLKNVLSSKSVRLNLKTLSFKGQIDEIISEYKQNWPINDLVMERFDPAEEEAEKADKEKMEKDKDEKDKGDAAEGGDKDIDTEKTTVEIENETKNSGVADSKTPQNLGSTLGTSLKPPPTYEESALNYMGPSGTKNYMRRLSIVPPDDNFADLFIDLSETPEESAWHFMSGSSDSIQTMTMMADVQPPSDRRMPYEPNMELPNNGKSQFISHS